jgi:hypothetical protein
MDYTGYNGEARCYGIPAAKHPDYKALAADLKALAKRHEQESDAAFAELFERAHEVRLEDGDMAALEREAMGEQRLRGIRQRQERRALTDQVPGTLYRLMGTTMVVRYDRIGKWSWDREFERLGWTRGKFGWTID